MLEYRWENKAGEKGMLLLNDEKIVGFLSYIVSAGTNNNNAIRYCNLSSWIVDPEFRSKSMQLLSNAFKISNCIILNLSPHENTRPMFKALRFETLAETEYRINPVKLNYAYILKKKKAEVLCSKLTLKNIKNTGTSNNLKQMFADHLPYENVHFYTFNIKKSGSSNELILAFNQKELQSSGMSEIPYKLLGKTTQAELLYSSSAKLLIDYFSEIMLAFVNKMKIRSVNVSENFVNKTDLKLEYVTATQKDCPWFYYSETTVDSSEIHVLYTEKVLLNF